MNSVNYDAFQSWRKIEHFNCSFSSIFSLFWYQLVSPVKRYQCRHGEAIYHAAVQVKPRLNAESETFPPFKKVVGEESDYPRGWSAGGSLSSKYRDRRQPQCGTRFIFSSYTIRGLGQICRKTIETTRKVLNFSLIVNTWLCWNVLS